MKKQNLKKYQKDLIDEQQLKRYNKWNGFNAYLVNVFFLACFFEWLAFVILALIKVKVMKINPLIYIMVYIILFIVFFFKTSAYQQVLDCKNNTFIKYKAICTEIGCTGNGVGHYHKFKILENDEEVAFSVDKLLFKKGDAVVIIVGLHSRQVIGAHRYID